VNIGAVFPQTEIGNDPAAIRDYAQTAEGLGYTHLVAYDHVLGATRSGPAAGKALIRISRPLTSLVCFSAILRVSPENWGSLPAS